MAGNAEKWICKRPIQHDEACSWEPLDNDDLGTTTPDRTEVDARAGGGVLRAIGEFLSTGGLSAVFGRKRGR